MAHGGAVVSIAVCPVGDRGSGLWSTRDGQLGSMASHLSAWLSVWLESEVVDGSHLGMEAVNKAGGGQRGS
ncbi:hypothetical protein SAMD00019534_038240 [Acytostelium subglobosum LB1]|uniref:hypothetical protein n=1 Tax=Acytostelium subglobosum LB1 TaxID=1410327 RepID=UPI0006451C35|nr:hypothetical protein SAMD00019534_038240 [Acytostelium subglobosum LB1]GAM20649.1 hypothetical protein SAMD00019534_038240 [Acytostelium subglobosum LB1]|eukprot:XP_012760170.1 hypothetical protein SAMD00019534_038240 [Acytostelium subglobosum LB1]